MEPTPYRRTIRLREYNYATAGSYFITICTQHKEHRFGYVADEAMVLNEAGRMIAERINAIPARFPGALIDAFVVMPNHIHLIVSLRAHVPHDDLVGAAHSGRPLSGANVTAENTRSHDSAIPDDWLAYSVFNVPGMDVPGMDVPGMDVPGMDVLDDGFGEFDGQLQGDPDGPRAGGHDGPPLHGIIGWFKASSTNYYINGVKDGRYPAFNRRLWQRNFYEHIIRTNAAYNQIDEYIRTNPQRWQTDQLR